MKNEHTSLITHVHTRAYVYEEKMKHNKEREKEWYLIDMIWYPGLEERERKRKDVKATSVTRMNENNYLLKMIQL